MTNVLIIGFPGQDACYLADLLLTLDYNVYGTMKRYSCPDYSNLDFLNLRSRGLKLLTADVTDIGSIFDALETSSPDEVYNLAAQSFVGNSWTLAHTTTQVDAIGPLNILECIRRFNKKIRFYQASTSEMFGNSNTNGFQTEDTPFMPRSPYGVAKLYGYHITKNFRESYGMYACSGILFNHESPIRGIEFVTRKVTDAVAKIALGKQEFVELGNLDAERDWGHASDFVIAQYLMMQQNAPDDYIVATGKKHSIRDLCRVAFSTVDIDNWEDYVRINPAFIRPAELNSLHASSTKAKDVMGWEPDIKFEDMIKEMVIEDLGRNEHK